MKKALITGITGQDGSYLAEFLLEKGYEVHGLIRRSSISNTGRIDHLIREDKIVLHGGDMTDSTSLVRIIGEVRPDEIYNHSATEFVCNFIGDINRLEENFLKASGAGLCAGVDLQKHCYIRLERMHVNGEVGGDAFQIEATVKNMEYYGLYIKYTLEAGGQQIKVIEKNSGKPLYDAGEKVTVSCRQEDIMQYEG